jgi:hypothetical protein
MTLHNFIRENAIADADFERCDNDENFMPIPTVCSSQENGDEEQGMDEFRDTTARMTTDETSHVYKLFQFGPLLDKFVWF